MSSEEMRAEIVYQAYARDRRQFPTKKIDEWRMVYQPPIDVDALELRYQTEHHWRRQDDIAPD